MGLIAQIKAFLLTLSLGIMAGMIFHYYQLTIRSLRVGKYLLYLMDLVLWVIMIIIIAAALLAINQGEMRVYVFMALLLGGVVYYKSISRYLQQPLYWLGCTTALIMKAFYGGMVRPAIRAKTWLLTQYHQRKAPPEDDLDE